MKTEKVISLLKEWRDWEEKSEKADKSFQNWVDKADNAEVYEVFKECSQELREFLGEKLMFKISDNRYLQLMELDRTRGYPGVVVLYCGSV